MFPSTRELEHDPHPAPLVFRAALGHSGDDAAARCDRSGSRPPRRRPCPCPRAEGLWHAADAGCARHLDQPRRRDALFRDAAGLRRRALLLCGVPHRSRPARALCRGAADPRRGDRPRPDRAFRAVPCAPADPLGPAVDRHRLGAADRRGPRCCRAYDLGQADRPFRSAEYRLAGLCGGAVEVTLVTREALLPSHNRRVRRLFERILAERRVAVLTDSEIVRVEPGALIGDDGKRIAFDEALWVTEAGAARWLAETGLPLTADGFIAIDETLLSTGDPSIFATGDVATMIAHPREKAGVYAVRQGRPLAANLRRALAGRRPRPAVPQRRGLALIGTGDGYAVASRGPFAAYGASWWRLKEWIDRRWMARYRELPEMTADQGEDPMRCGGCAAKVPAIVLARVMERLHPASSEAVMIGLDSPDDAALISFPGMPPLLQTVDFFRAMVDDPYLFGRIAATHALGDIYAMGGVPESALAIATLPPARPSIVEHDLFHMLRGGLDVLEAAGAVLVGGHSAEGAELALGFAVTGRPHPGKLLRKGGLRSGDRLILTKPLGTGVILAADARGLAPAPIVEGAIATMVQSAGPAAECLLAYRATACTDVTGFGLLGHLLEMLRASEMDAVLDPEAIPALDGAVSFFGRGIASSLHADNIAALAALGTGRTSPADPIAALLIDPQTAGGLLAGVPADRAVACVAELRGLGYRAAEIGFVTHAAGSDPRVHLEQGATRALPEPAVAS